ncbi:uncharacterized protein Dvir_GJ26792 [Drosophila virilis]|uniref:C-type lectin domain-containing protein n=1 Tax=Drosophila virilis TaxID=7244 RepID=A0A0Q9WA76_DROVI|nr:uncharacterized protein Dvir_GJ26792 [Drosophila virilis]
MSSTRISIRRICIFEKIGSKYYYIGDNEELNWFAAAAKCIKLGGHLASVQNQQEFNAIRAKLTKPGYWLDINDLAEEGKYMSSTTGEKAVFIRWDSINPNNQDNAENCVELGINHDYEMNDLTCLYRNNFICEKKFDN